jgi:Family of unknown function (DUF6279)
MLGRTFKALAMTLLLLSVVACSSTTFVYNRLDFLLPWYLDDYVDLSRSQKKYLDELLQPYLYWHRTEELARYIVILDQIDAALDKPLTLEDVEQVSKSFEEAWSRLETEGLKWLLALGDRLSDEQIAEFLQQLYEKQTEYEQEYLGRTDEQYLEETYENFLDSFQDYLGKLDSSQKTTLRQASAAMERVDSTWLEERSRWLEELSTLLMRESGWQDRLRLALDERDQNRSEAYQRGYEKNLAQIHRAIVAVVNNRTDRQDRKLRGKIAGFREDLRTLIEQAEP